MSDKHLNKYFPSLTGFRLFLALALPCLLSMLSACTTQYVFSVGESTLQDLHLLDNHHVARKASWVLHSSDRIYLANTGYSTNKPGRSGIDRYPRARSSFDLSLYKRLLDDFTFIQRAETGETLDQAISNAKVTSAQIIIRPQVLLVENNLNTFSEMSEGREVHARRKDGATYGLDRTRIRVAIYEVHSGQLLDVISIESESRLFANSRQNLDRYYRAAAHQLVSNISNKPSF